LLLRLIGTAISRTPFQVLSMENARIQARSDSNVIEKGVAPYALWEAQKPGRRTISSGTSEEARKAVSFDFQSQCQAWRTKNHTGDIRVFRFSSATAGPLRISSRFSAANLAPPSEAIFSKKGWRL